LLGELRRVLACPRLAAVFSDPKAIVDLVEDLSVVVEPIERLTVVADEADNRVLEAAVAGGAELLVTGDRALLGLGRFRGVRIMGPVAALALLADGE
jgi:putative PIN family toxin of toxin-antitoxin system